MSGNTEILTAHLYTPAGAGDISFPFHVTDFDKKMMERALIQAEDAIARGDIPVGAVLISNKDHGAAPEIFEASSTEFSDQDLTAHAEVNAYRKARDILGRNLGSCALYITVEPCVACTYYIYKGNVGTVFYAAERSEAPDFFQQRSVDFTQILGDSGRTTAVVGGLMRDEALELLKPKYRRR